MKKLKSRQEQEIRDFEDLVADLKLQVQTLEAK